MLTGAKLGKNSTGFWEVRWTEKEQGGGWRTRRVSTRTRDRAEAETFRRAWLREAVKDAPVDDGAPTVAEVIDAYVTLYVQAQGACSSQDYTLRAIKRELGARRMDELSAADFVAFARKRRREGRTNGTIRREFSSLIAAARWCARKNKSLRLDLVPVIDLPPESQPRMLWLTEEQEAKFFAAALALDWSDRTQKALSLMIALGLNTAARCGAMEGLTWGRVDLARGVIDYRDPAMRVTRKRRTAVPIGPRLRPVLERAFAERASNDPAEKVVPGVGLRVAWRAFVKAQGLPANFGMHAMRHTWVTLALRRGVSLWDVSSIVGDDIKTLQKSYAHHCSEHLARAVV